MPDSYGGTPSADSYYERLGVDPDASEETIKRASKLAKRSVHPDNNSSEQTTAEREFDRVTDAADALTDSESRGAYDTFIDDQGPATGTDRYEEWDAADRPKSPTEWLSEPRSNGSSSTTSGSTTSRSTTSRSTTTGSSRTRTHASRRPNTGRQPNDRRQPNTGRQPNDRRRPGEQTATSTPTDETAETAADDSYTTAASTPETETRETAETASTTPTGRPNAKRAPESVLGEDPEELYNKYVLDSDAAWGPSDAEAGQAGNDSGTAVAPSVAGAVVSRFVSAEVAADIDRVAAAPKPWWLRGGLAVVLLTLAVVVGPVAERLALLPVVAVPRIGLWLYPTLAAGVTLAPELVPLETSAGWLAAYAGLSVGYVLLGRWLRMA